MSAERRFIMYVITSFGCVLIGSTVGYEAASSGLSPLDGLLSSTGVIAILWIVSLGAAYTREHLS